MQLTQDVFMPQQHRVVDLSLSEPGLLVSGRENLDCNVLSLPLTPPHFTITALTWGKRSISSHFIMITANFY